MNSGTIIPQSPVARISHPGGVRRQPHWLVVSLLVAATVVIGWADYFTGWEWSMAVVYLAPILMGGMVGRERRGANHGRA